MSPPGAGRGLSSEDQSMSSSTEVPKVAPSTDGRLIVRVRQLRLDGPLAGNGSAARRGSMLPWILFGLLAFTWIFIGVRWYRDPDRFVPQQSASSDAKSKTGKGAEAAPGELLLHLKGTITPFLEIKLSPDDVSGVVERIDFKEG